MSKKRSNVVINNRSVDGTSEAINIYLPPSEVYEYKVSVMALCAGRLPFPKLVIRSSMFDSTALDEITWLSIPDTIFILVTSSKDVKCSDDFWLDFDSDALLLLLTTAYDDDVDDAISVFSRGRFLLFAVAQRRMEGSSTLHSLLKRTLANRCDCLRPSHKLTIGLERKGGVAERSRPNNTEGRKTLGATPPTSITITTTITTITPISSAAPAPAAPPPRPPSASASASAVAVAVAPVSVSLSVSVSAPSLSLASPSVQS
uniref:Uncharacterized protein n=1 Tax=Setaria digitata TaxID=48799 RepID=A0A915Q1R2_9BILA